MRRVLKTLGLAWAEWRDNRRNARRLKHSHILAADAREAIQVKEYCGELYLSVKGSPVLPAALLNQPIPDALRQARSVWAVYGMQVYDYETAHPMRQHPSY